MSVTAVDADQAALARVRAAYRHLRQRTDPRGHDLLATMEAEHLLAVAEMYLSISMLERVSAHVPQATRLRAVEWGKRRES